MQASLPINRAIDINKLLAFLRAGASATFQVKEELRDLVIKALKEFARSHRITVRYVEPGREKLIICSTAGLMAGAGAGAALAGVAGAVAGAGVGLAVGYACAHVSVSISPLADGQPGFTVDIVRA